jgi:flagellar protein FlgJ
MSERPDISRRDAIKMIVGTAAAVALGVVIAYEESNAPNGPDDTQQALSSTSTTEATPTVPSIDPETPSGEQLPVDEYIQVYRDYAREVEAEYDIDHRVVLAQSYIETGGASSELALEANAFFGIKAKDDWDGPIYNADSPEEPAGGGEHQDVPSDFRMYQTVRESFLDYGDRITTSGYYEDAVAARNDPEAYIAAIAPIYATDSGYAEKLLAKYQEVLAAS